MGWMHSVGEFYSNTEARFLAGQVQENQAQADPPVDPPPDLPPDSRNPDTFDNPSPTLNPSLPTPPGSPAVNPPGLFSSRVQDFISQHRSTQTEQEANLILSNPSTDLIDSPPEQSLLGIQVAYSFLLDDLATADPAWQDREALRDLYYTGLAGNTLVELHNHRLDLLGLNGGAREAPEILQIESLMDHAHEDLRRLQQFQDSPPESAEAWQAYADWAQAAAPRFDAIYAQTEAPLPSSNSNLDDLMVESLYLDAYRQIYEEIRPNTGNPPAPENLPATREGLYQLLTLSSTPEGGRYLDGRGRRQLAEILFFQERFPQSEEWSQILGESPLEYGNDLPGAVQLLHSLSRRHLGELATWTEREHSRVWQETLYQDNRQNARESVGMFFGSAQQIVTRQIRAINDRDPDVPPETALHDLGELLENMTSIRMRTRYAREHLPFLSNRAGRWFALDDGESWQRMQQLSEALPLDYEALFRDYQNTSAEEVLRDGSYLSRSLQLSLAQQFTREFDSLNATLVGLDQVLEANFLDDVVLGNWAVGLTGFELDRSEDQALAEDLFALRGQYLHLVDDIQELSNVTSLTDVLAQSEGLFEQWGELSRDSLFGDLSYQQGRTWSLLHDREIIEASIVDAAASFAGAGMASFLTRLPSVIRVANGAQRMLRSSRVFSNMRPFFQRGILNGLRIYGSAVPEAFFQATTSAGLHNLIDRDTPGGFMAQWGEELVGSMGFVFFQRRMRPVFSRLTQPFARAGQRLRRWGQGSSNGWRRALASMGVQGSELGFHLSQLGGETAMFSLYRLWEAGLQGFASRYHEGLRPDWDEVFSMEALGQDALQVAQEYITERPAEALGQGAASVVGQGHRSQLETQIQSNRDFFQSEGFADYPPALARQRLRLFREQLEDLQAIRRSQGESFENIRPLATSHPELWNNLQELAQEIESIGTRERELEVASREWLETYGVLTRPSPIEIPQDPFQYHSLGFPLALAAGTWVPSLPLDGFDPSTSLAWMLGSAALGMAWLRQSGRPSTFTELLRQSGESALPPRDPRLDYNSHYQINFQQPVPTEPGHGENPTQFLDLAWQEFPALSASHPDHQVFFTGREFGRGSASTAYEGFLIGPDDQYQRVAVLAADHALDLATASDVVTTEIVDRVFRNLQFITEHGLGNVEWYGSVELPEGNTGIITNIAPGLHIAERSTLAQVGAWINSATLQQLHQLSQYYASQGRGFGGDFQFQVDPDGNTHLIDFESLLGPVTPQQAWENNLSYLATAWSAAGRSQADWAALLTAANDAGEIRQDLVAPGDAIFDVTNSIGNQVLAESAFSFTDQPARSEFENALLAKLRERFPFLSRNSYLWSEAEWNAWQATFQPYYRSLYQTELESLVE